MNIEKSNVELEKLDSLELISKKEYDHLVNTNKKQSDCIIELENLVDKLKADNQVYKGKLIKIRTELE